MQVHSLRTRLRIRGAVLALIVGQFVLEPGAFSQGCMPGPFLTLGPAAGISPHLEAGLKKYEEKVAQTEQRLLQKLAAKYNLVLQPKAL